MGGIQRSGPRLRPRRFPSTSFGLIERAKRQDASAWRHLVRLYAPLVYYWCRQAGLAREDTADVGQEIFSAAAQAIAGFHHDQRGDTFRGWLNTITQNKIRDFRRRRQLPQPVTGGSDHQMWLAQLAAEEEQSGDSVARLGAKALLCRKVLEQLETDFHPRTWHAFWRTVIDDCHASDVADELGMTATAVRKAKSRVLRRVREELSHADSLSQA